MLCLPGGTRLSTLAKVHPQFLLLPFEPALSMHPFLFPRPRGGCYPAGGTAATGSEHPEGWGLGAELLIP